MRLAIVTPQFPDAPGAPTLGVGAATAGLVLGLRQVAPEVEIHVFDFMAERARGPLAWGDGACTYHSVPPTRLATYAPSTRLVPRTLERAVMGIHPEVIHVQATASAMDCGPVPSVLTVHGISELDTRIRARRFGRLRGALVHHREAAARARYAHVILIAGYVAQHLAGQLRGSSHLIRNAVDQRFFDAYQEDASRGPVITQVGVLSVRKNPLVTVEAMHHLAREGVDFELRLVGPPGPADYVDTLHRRVAELGLEDRVQFVGQTDRDGIIDELRRARVLVLPSRQETAPMVIAEAGAMGVPAVVAPAGGTVEMVADGFCGAVIDPDSPRSVADALLPYVTDAGYAGLHGKRARELAQRHRADHVARATLSVYQSALGRDGAKAGEGT